LVCKAVIILEIETRYFQLAGFQLDKILNCINKYRSCPRADKNMFILKIGMEWFLILLLMSVGGCGHDERKSKLDNQYFVRCARYDIVEDAIVAYDFNSPRVITLNPWFEVIFMAAYGQRTVGEFIVEISSEYTEGAPKGLATEIVGYVEEMIEEGLIRISDTTVDLPYYLASPVSEQDPDKAKKFMITDGIIKEE